MTEPYLTMLLELPSVAGLAYALFKMGRIAERAFELIENIHEDTLDHTLPIGDDGFADD